MASEPAWKKVTLSGYKLQEEDLIQRLVERFGPWDYQVKV